MSIATVTRENDEASRVWVAAVDTIDWDNVSGYSMSDDGQRHAMESVTVHDITAHLLSVAAGATRYSDTGVTLQATDTYGRVNYTVTVSYNSGMFWRYIASGIDNENGR